MPHSFTVYLRGFGPSRVQSITDLVCNLRFGLVSCFLSRQRPALGKCLAAFSAAFPVAFLEPHINKFNSFSVYNSKGSSDRAGLSNMRHPQINA